MGSSEENNIAGRTTRRRATARRVDSVSTKSPRKRATRRVVAPAPEINRVVERQEVVERVGEKVARKAPTPLSKDKLRRRQSRKHFLITNVIIMVGLGFSALVGYTDEGQIDVEKTIEARNERIRTNTADERDIKHSTVAVPVQNTNQKADGGLVGLGLQDIPKPTPEPAVPTSTATSTDETASSSESVADEDSNAPESEDTEEESSETGLPVESISE
ncbi:hypothetical protein KC865_02245 [Candidatus Kaiserbacteria bacterium]|nr:hypothetical protein [Candidatus Kaiserbacteria bacterium]USN92389.1 MAG: hypothetical protein H6782_01075 [Candidatus Nomurabacteria bacterium]